MSKKMLEQVSEETMRFMRGRYALDEVGNGKDELKFRRGGKTVLTVYIREDRYDFLVIFGKGEREKFEQARASFPPKIQDIYDSSKTYHDGKWMMIPVGELETLEAVKELVKIKRKPNRKPFSKEGAVYSKCGQRCDLCVHYTGGTISEQFRLELRERLERVYRSGDWGEDMMLCPGCHNKPEADRCEQLDCAVKKGRESCLECGEYPCALAPVVHCRIAPESILADDVTWGVLPFVPDQFGN